MLRRRILRSLLLLCVAMGFSVATSVRAAQYSITFLDTLPIPPGTDPTVRDSFAYAINEQGDIVGESTLDRTGHIGQTRPVQWNGTSEAVELWDDQTFGGKGLGINCAGFVVGRSGCGSGIPWPGPGIPGGGAFIWNPTTRQFMDLGDLGSARAEATGINDAGHVSGSAEALEVFIIDGMPVILPVPRAFIWDDVNGMHDLGTLEGNGEGSRGAAINNSGKVAGWSLMSDGTERAFIWDAANGMQDLGALSMAFGSSGRAFAINDLDQIVGTWDGPEGGPFIWDSTDGIQRIASDAELQELGVGFLPQSINYFGAVVGFGVSVFGEPQAVYWERGVGLKLLADLVQLDANWELQAAFGINDRGEIVGTAYNTSDGRFRGFLLTPIPEPNSIALWCMGGLALGVSRYKTGKRCERGLLRAR